MMGPFTVFFFVVVLGMRSFSLVALVGFTCLTCMAWSGVQASSWDQGAGSDDDWKQYLKYLRSQQIRHIVQNARDGNPSAQYIVVSLYSAHAGPFNLEYNLDESLWWCQSSAKQGHPLAQVVLGSAYHFGLGVQKDLATAAHWYTQAAKSNVFEAYNSLGVCFDFGEGKKQNAKRAAYYYKLAADRNFALGQYNLGNAYYRGRGVDQDIDQACSLFLKASYQGLQEAKYMVSVCENVHKVYQGQYVRVKDLPYNTKDQYVAYQGLKKMTSDVRLLSKGWIVPQSSKYKNWKIK